MCNNSLIYLATPATSTVAINGVLPFSTIVRRRGQTIQQSNNSIVLNASGYYKVSLTVTFTAPVAGVATIQLLQDGVVVQGATASATITTATTEVRSISYDAIVRVRCCDTPSVLTVANTGVAITSSNIAIDVEYLD